MSTKKAQGRGRPSIYNFDSLPVKGSKRVNLTRHPGAANAAYQTAFRTGGKFSVAKLGKKTVVVTRTA